jgi:hypothetical protein
MASSHDVEDTIDLHGSYPFYGRAIRVARVA